MNIRIMERMSVQTRSSPPPDAFLCDWNVNAVRNMSGGQGEQVLSGIQTRLNTDAFHGLDLSGTVNRDGQFLQNNIVRIKLHQCASGKMS